MKLIDLLSIFNCKLCGKSVPTRTLHCADCKQYYISITPQGQIESEMISYANYRFIFLPEGKEAHVLECDSSNYKILNHVAMDELTPELATYWFTKLKKYVIFQ